MTTQYEGFPLGKAWIFHVGQCARTTHADLAVAMVYREIADHRTMTAGIGADLIEFVTGIGEKNARDRHRRSLAEAGWLVDTEEDRGQANVYRLEVPQCDCGRHDTWVMAAEDAGERLQRAVAVVQRREPGDGRWQSRTQPEKVTNGRKVHGQRPPRRRTTPVTVTGVSDPNIPDTVTGVDGPNSPVTMSRSPVTMSRQPGHGDRGTTKSTTEATTEVVDDDVVTDVDRRARERDSAPAVGPGYVAPLAEPRTDDEATADGSAAAGSGASAASQDDDTEARSADEENDVIEIVCETHGVELPCPDCEHLASQADLVAGPGRPAENGGTPGGHDPGAPRELSAAEAAVLAAVQKASPEAIIANDASAAISRADAHDDRGYYGALAGLKLRELIESRTSYPRDGGSLEEYFLPGCVPPLREGHDSAPLARSWADEPATPRTRGRGVVPEAPEPDMGFLSSFGQHDDSEDEDDMIDMFD